MRIAFIFTPFCSSPWTIGEVRVDATNGRYAASAPEFLMPSTMGPTSVLPKSTVVFV